MKRIGLLSDTHAYWDERYVQYFRACDEIWHAGDIGSDTLIARLERIAPVRAVYGNIDSYALRAIYPLDQRFVIEGVDVWMTHIGGYPGKYEPRVKQSIFYQPPKLLISGHSHILKVMNDRNLGLLHINPGAAGKYGFHTVRTLIRFVLDQGDIKDLEVIELS